MNVVLCLLFFVVGPLFPTDGIDNETARITSAKNKGQRTKYNPLFPNSTQKQIRPDTPPEPSDTVKTRPFPPDLFNFST